MSVALLTITHDHIGANLLATAQGMLMSCPLATAHLEVPLTADPDYILRQAQGLAQELNGGDGVLILTDIYGATPTNIALRLLAEPNVRVISGLNLPMLIRVLNYPGLDLDGLAAKALSGGRDGIMVAPQTE